MNDIFHNLLDVCVIIYLDDIIIYLEDMSQHHIHVKEVLQKLHANGLYAGAQKCEFHKNTVEYLRSILSPDSLHMAQASQSEGCSILLPLLIHRYSKITVPLTQLTCKYAPWNFNNNCQMTLNYLREKFTHAPVLTHWVLNSHMVLETNTLDYGLAAILFVYTSDSEIQPVAFHS